MTRVKDRRECPTLNDDIQAYLASGGTIKHCPPCAYADDARGHTMQRQNRQDYERTRGRGV